MKYYRLSNFNNIFFLIWIIITALLWAFDDSEYPLVLQKILSGISLLGVLCSSTYFLCNYILPKAIQTNKLYTVLPHFFGASFLQAILLWLFQEGIFLLEYHHVLPVSEYTHDRETFLTTLASSFPVTILVNLGFGGLKFYFEHSKLYQQHLSLQKAHLEIQVQSLQSKISPHFMFNVLNHVHMLIQKDTERASTLLIQYADILRYQLYEGAADSVPIAEEVTFIKNYVEVEKYRWTNSLEVNHRFEVHDSHIRIAPQLLMVFIENAFKHVGRSTDQKGYINFLLQQESSEIKLQVHNSKGSEKKNNLRHSGLGLKNVRERLQLLYPDRHELTIHETAQSYDVRLHIYL